MTTLQTKDLDSVLDYIRPAVRREKPYIVGGVPNVTVKLNQNECPYDLPDDMKRDLIDTFWSLPANRYPTEQPHRLRDALAGHHGCEPGSILIGNGSNELTHTFGLTMIERGTPVVLPRPMFALYESVVRVFEGDLTAVPPRPDLRFDTEALLEAIRRVQPALVVITTPNNPTGRAMTLDEVEAIVQAAPGFVVVDEAYVEFAEEESAETIREAHPNMILLRTFSKAFGLAGVRLGYLIAHPAVIEELMKARLPFMVDRFSEATALSLLHRYDLVRERVAAMKAGCREIAAALEAMEGVTTVPSQANFLLFKTPLAPEETMRRLAEAGVLVRSMSGYPELKGYLRVSSGTPDENKAFLGALKNALS